MSDLTKRRNNLILSIQRKERSQYLSKLRQEILCRWREQDEKTQAEAVLYAAFVSYEQQNGPYLDIYVNIEHLLDETFRNTNQSHFTYKISLFLFISLTSSDEVITYMIATNSIREWQKMIFLAKHNYKCQQYLYQRMCTFLEFICAKYNIEPFHAQQFYQQELLCIFNQEFTNNLIEDSFHCQEDSEHYAFLEKYISFIPPSHLFPFFISGFAFETIYNKNPSISITFLGKFQSCRIFSEQYDEIYQQYLQKFNENNEIKDMNSLFDNVLGL